MERILYLACLMSAVSLLACGDGTSEKKAGGCLREDCVQECEGVEIESFASELDTVDWATLMPQIVKNLPPEVVDKRFQGKIGPDSIDLGGYWGYPYEQNLYTLVDDDGDEHYLFSAMAVPYTDSEDILVIVNSQGGVDGLGTLLLNTLRYNSKTNKFTDISDKVPGVEPKVELLDLAWLNEHPDWIQEIKRTYDYSLTYNLSSNDGICKLVVNYDDNCVCYDIDDQMYSTIPDWYDRLALTYVWDGKSFELVK